MRRRLVHYVARRETHKIQRNYEKYKHHIERSLENDKSDSGREEGENKKETGREETPTVKQKERTPVAGSTDILSLLNIGCKLTL